MRPRNNPASGLGGKEAGYLSRTAQTEQTSARGGNQTSPLRVPQDVREAIRKTHPMESCFLEYLLEKNDPRVILVDTSGRS